MKFRKLILTICAFFLTACSFSSSVSTKLYIGRLYKLSKITRVEEENEEIESWQTFYNEPDNSIDLTDKLMINSAAQSPYAQYNTIQYTFDGNFRQKFTYKTSESTTETVIKTGTYYEVDTTTTYKIFMSYQNDSIGNVVANDRLLELNGGGGIDPNYIRVPYKFELSEGNVTDVYLWYYCAIILGDSLMIDKNNLVLDVGTHDWLTLTRVPAIAGLEKPVWTIEQDGRFVNLNSEECVISLDISEDGFIAKVTGLKPGSADIYGRINNDASYALLLCHVEVK